jgi:hypothetical protein
MAWASSDLTAVEGAIRAIMTGNAVQSYTIHGVNVQRMQLKDLMLLRTNIRRELALANGGADPDVVNVNTGSTHL